MRDPLRSRRIRSVLTVATWVALSAVVLGVCGIPTDDSARAIEPDRVPYGLLDDEPGSGANGAEPNDANSVGVGVFLVGAETRLVRVERVVTGPLTHTAALEALFEQTPTPLERSQGLYTAIPDQTTLLDQPRADGGVLEINVSKALLTVQGDRQRQAFAQIVWTATSLAGVTRVRFRVEGQPQAATVGDGRSVNEPVGQSAYMGMSPRS